MPPDPVQIATMVASAATASALSTATGTAVMLNALHPWQVVYFDLNPESIKVNAMTGSGGGRVSNQRTQSNSSPRKVSLTVKGVLTGWDTKMRCDQLITWTGPEDSLLDQAIAAVGSALGARPNLRNERPKIHFVWGLPIEGFLFICTVKKVMIDYKRFDFTGTPERAEVTLTLDEEPSLLGILPTNPTSGGPPGRESRLLHQSENLQHIAQNRYGRPQFWRQVAEANGVDDPLRVRPGDKVYLPNPTEIRESAREQKALPATSR